MKTLPAGFPGQCHYSLKHVISVAESVGVTLDNAISAHCYIVRDEDMLTALEIARAEIPDRVSY